MIFESHSEKETFDFAEKLGLKAEAGEIYTLEGELGAGKTVFAKGFAAGLGIDESVVSPTFTILCEYTGGRLPLYHFDVYRITDPDEMYETGFEEYLSNGGVCLIEWASLIKDILPEGCKKIIISKDDKKGFDYRRIELL